MDSFTQFILGAAVGEAVLGRKVGARAALIGGIVATLPDLDVFINHGSAVADFTMHRGFSHSWFTAIVAAPLIVLLLSRLWKRVELRDWRWHAMIFLSLATHSALDAFTIYGTQLFWPLTSAPVSIGSIFIIDPIYTLPLLAGVMCALLMRRNTVRGHRINTYALAFSTAYLLWGLAAQNVVEERARADLIAQGIDAPLIKATPAPFNTLLWRVIAMGDTRYHIGYRSLLADKTPIRFSSFQSQPHLLAPIQDAWPVQRLQWFTHGFYAVAREQDKIIMTDLRMGMEGAYIFRFDVGRYDNTVVVPGAANRSSQPRDYLRMRDIFRRIFDERITLE